MRQPGLQPDPTAPAEKFVPDSALQVENLQYKIGFNRILKNINFSLRQGEVLALLGPNGSGKSTLLKCLAGLLPHHGSKKLLGQNPRKNYELRKLIGYVGHETFLYLKLSARENLIFYAQLFGIRVNAENLLSEYALTDAGEQLVETYSRGMKQRLTLARAMLPHPSILLMDEPFTGLDQQGTQFLRDKIRDLKGNVTIVFATHELQFAYEISDRLLLLRNGGVAFWGSKMEAHPDIESFYKQKIQ